MATLSFTIDYAIKEAPPAAKLSKDLWALDRLFHFLLLTGPNNLTEGFSTRLAWREMLSFPLHPESTPLWVRDEDVLRITYISIGSKLEAKASSNNKKVLDKVNEVIRELNRVRENSRTRPEAEKIAKIREPDGRIQAVLIIPVTHSLEASELPHWAQQTALTLLTEILLTLLSDSIYAMPSNIQED